MGQGGGKVNFEFAPSKFPPVNLPPVLLQNRSCHCRQGKRCSQKAPAKKAAAKTTAAKARARPPQAKPQRRPGRRDRQRAHGGAPEAVKKMWEYIKAHNLQDPKDKRTIVADDKLRAVFGKDSAGMFELAGILGNHLGGDA